MNFLVKKDYNFGAIHGALFQAIEKAYPSPEHIPGVINRKNTIILLGEPGEIEKAHAELKDFFDNPLKPGTPRAVGLAVDWYTKDGGKTELNDAWMAFVKGAISEGKIHNHKLAEDVDAILLVDHRVYDELSKTIDPSKTTLIDYTAMELDEAIQFLVDTLKASHTNENSYVPSWKRGEGEAGPSMS